METKINRKVIVAVLLTVLIGATSFVVLRQGIEQNPKEADSVSKINDKNIYTNTQYSYQIMVPVGYEYVEDTGSVKIVVQNYEKLGASPLQMTVSASETKLRDFVNHEKNFNQKMGWKTSEESFNFNGSQATRLDVKQNSDCSENDIDGCRQICTIWEKNNLTYTFCGVVFRSGKYDEFKKIYDETLSSFRFLK